MQKDNVLLKTYNEQNPTVKLIIIVVLLIVTYMIVTKAMAAIQNAKLDKFKDRASVDGSGKKRDVRPLVDSIYTNLEGVNVWIYPEIVNQLVNLSDEELQDAYDYFQREYGATTGMTLTAFIDAEYDGGEYEPAISKLERKGLV